MSDRFLMCPPDHFEVAYVINPWMAGNVARCDQARARRQWRDLHALLSRHAEVAAMPAASGVPDMVFTANAGLVLGERVVLTRFRHPQRQAEEPLFERWFGEQGFEVLKLDRHLHFEGAGDALFDRSRQRLWLGHGHRSDAACAPALERLLQVEVQPLRLADPRFYHLDTCFCPLEGGYLMYFPDAFDDASRQRIARLVPQPLRITVDERDAAAFACNAVNSGRHVFLNRASPALQERLQAHGFLVHQSPLGEFIKAGGAAKCLTLKLNERADPDAAARSAA